MPRLLHRFEEHVEDELAGIGVVVATDVNGVIAFDTPKRIVHVQ